MATLRFSDLMASKAINEESSFSTHDQVLAEVKKGYDAGISYTEVDYNGTTVKFRMHKDHGRNHFRNDDETNHNLSLVNAKGNNSYFENETFRGVTLQKQVFGIGTWEDAKEAILDFLFEIDHI